MRQRRLEVVVECGLEQMQSECGVTLEHLVRIDLLHEGFGRTIVLVANADAHGRKVVDEEIDPMIRRNDDKKIGTDRLEPVPDFIERGGELVAVRARHRFPLARDERPMTGGKDSDELSHGARSPPFAQRWTSWRAASL